MFSPALSIRLREHSMRGAHSAQDRPARWSEEDASGLQHANPWDDPSHLPEFWIAARRVTDAVLQQEIQSQGSVAAGPGALGHAATAAAADGLTSLPESACSDVAERTYRSGTCDSYHICDVHECGSVEGSDGQPAEADESAAVHADQVTAGQVDGAGCSSGHTCAGPEERGDGAGGRGGSAESGGGTPEKKRAEAVVAAAGAALGASTELVCSGKILAHRLDSVDGHLSSEEGASMRASGPGRLSTPWREIKPVKACQSTCPNTQGVCGGGAVLPLRAPVATSAFGVPFDLCMRRSVFGVLLPVLEIRSTGIVMAFRVTAVRMCCVQMRKSTRKSTAPEQTPLASWSPVHGRHCPAEAVAALLSLRADFPGRRREPYSRAPRGPPRGLVSPRPRTPRCRMGHSA